MKLRPHVHVGEPRRVAVDGHRGDVVDGVGALVGGEGPAPGRRVERDLAAVVVRVFVEGADRVDGGELHEFDAALLPRVEPGRHVLEQREEALFEGGGQPVGRAPRGQAPAAPGPGAARACRGPSRPPRAASGASRSGPRGAGPGPSPRGPRGAAPPPSAAPPRPPAARCERRARGSGVPSAGGCARAAPRGEIVLVLHQVVELHLFQLGLEALEAAVLRQHDPPVVDQRAVGVAARLEVAGVALQGLVREHDA